jgi:glycosyltransferase involved in cell wall biosynthesis
MKRLSIIIPIYKVEPFVEKCLRSLEDQDIPTSDFEIICINDGSPDNSVEVVKHMQKEFNNIILIEQENQGVSSARNSGIDNAIGKYLLFIDPDDYVEKNSFHRILRSSDEYDAQVSFLGFTVLNNDGTVRNQKFDENFAKKIYSGIESYFLARGDGNTDPDRIWAVLFKTEFLNINNLRYLPKVPYLEDGEFIARILCLAERCIFDGHLFYHEKATKGFIMAASNLKSFQANLDLSAKQQEFLNQPVLKFVLLSINSSIGWHRNKRFSSTIKTLKELSLRKIRLEGCNRIYRLYGKAYNISPYLSTVLLFLRPRINRLYTVLVKRS